MGFVELILRDQLFTRPPSTTFGNEQIERGCSDNSLDQNLDDDLVNHLIYCDLPLWFDRRQYRFLFVTTTSYESDIGQNYHEAVS